MHRGAEGERRAYTSSDLNCLDRLQRHHRLRQKAVQSLIPLRVGSQSRGDIVSDHFEYATHGITRAQCQIHLGLHAQLGFRVSAVKQHLIFGVEPLQGIPADLIVLQPGVTYRDHMAENLNAKVAQKQLCNRADGHTPRGFPGRSPSST